MIKGIAKEQSDDCSEDEFLQIYRENVTDPHDFITIDFNPKVHRFRKGFDHYIPFDGDPGMKPKVVTQPEPEKKKKPEISADNLKGAKPV